MEDDGPLQVKVLPPPIPLTTADNPEAVEVLLASMGPEHGLVGVSGCLCVVGLDNLLGLSVSLES